MQKKNRNLKILKRLSVYVVAILIPLFLNWIIQKPSICSFVGKDETWLVFWATYIGAFVSFLMVLATTDSSQKNVALNIVHWRVDWLNTYSNAATNVMAVVDRVTISQVIMGLLKKDFQNAANMGRDISWSFKKSSFVLTEIINRYDEVFERERRQEYIHRIDPYLKLFQQKAGEIIQFALICEYMEYKESQGNMAECRLAINNMKDDMEKAGYSHIVDFINNDFTEDAFHNAIVNMQINFSTNVQDMEEILLEIVNENTKLAYDISVTEIGK